MTRPWLSWLAPILVVLAVVAAYWGAGDHLKLRDDNLAVWSNPAVTGESLAPVFWGRFYRTVDESRPVVRPIPTAVHRAEVAKFFQDRTPFQRTQVAVHGVVAVLFLATLLTLGMGALPSTLAALVFAVHPGLTSSVLRMEGMSELMCLGFSFLAIMAMRRSTDRDARSGRPWAWMTMSWLALLAALLSKETAYALVPVLIAWVYTSTTRPGPSGASGAKPARPAASTGPSNSAVLLAGTLAVALVALAHRTVSIGMLDDGQSLAKYVTTDTGTPFGNRLLFGLAAIAEYTRLLLFPHKLAYTYDFLFGATGPGWFARIALGAVMFAASVGLFVAGILRRHSGLAFFGGLLSAGLFAGSGIAGSVGDFAAERSMYFIVPGFLGLILLAWSSAPRPAPQGMVATAVAVVVVGLLTARTMARTNDYIDENTLQEAQLRDHPGSAEPYFEMGNRLLTLQQWTAARNRYEDALDRRANHWMAWVNLGAAYAGEGEAGLAIRAYDRAIEGMSGNPDFASPMARALFNRALEYMKQNRNREAAESLERTLEVFPNHLRAHANLGFIYANSSEYYDQSIEHFRRALELEAIEENRTVLLKNLKQVEKLRDEERARKGTPANPRRGGEGASDPDSGTGTDPESGTDPEPEASDTDSDES